MDEESEVIRIEALCKSLYESQDANERQEAEKALVTFQNSSGSESQQSTNLLLSLESYTVFLKIIYSMPGVP